MKRARANAAKTLGFDGTVCNVWVTAAVLRFIRLQHDEDFRRFSTLSAAESLSAVAAYPMPSQSPPLTRVFARRRMRYGSCALRHAEANAHGLWSRESVGRVGSEPAARLSALR